jgi:hypothetical protein
VITLLSRGNRAPKAPMNGRRRAVVVGSAVIVLAGLGVGLTSVVNLLMNNAATCMNRGVTVMMHGVGGQCVGVTDGSYPLDPGSKTMAHLENEIAAEDQRVTRSGSGYLSVAYLMPISTTGGVEPINSVIEQLAGAYAEQRASNNAAWAARAAGTASAVPPIQLLIATSGTDAAGYKTTVKVIETDAATQHLVAVAGIGVSLDSTVDEVKQLTGGGIPVIGGSITSDKFNNIPDMVRASPSNSVQVKAILDFIKPQAGTAVLVEDVNQTDSYDRTLVTAFKASYLGQIVDTELYDTTHDIAPDSSGAQLVAGKIALMPPNICRYKGSVVLFAGRGRDLGTLLDDLGQHCQGQAIKIVTGDDVVDMIKTSSVEYALAHGITLEYAGDANPHEWDKGTTPLDEEGRQAFRTFSQAFGGLSPAISINDGNAMMGYDAMLTTISAIGLAGANPAPNAVGQMLGALHGAQAVPGVSGPINLSTSYQGAGSQGSNPVGKVVPILRLNSNWTTSFVHLEQPLSDRPSASR